MTKGISSGEKYSGMYLLLLHGACFLLVVAYVNMFQFWAWMSRILGPGQLTKMLPIIMTLVVLLAVFLRFIRRVKRGYRINFVFFGLGIVGAFLALAIPDPHVPIKRIHVAEYIILSFVVRYVLSHRLDGASLTFFTALATALYGVHDEMLQGLHSLRYYGWRDMVVNSVAGLSGAMLGHGLVCFDARESAKKNGPEKGVSAGSALLFASMLAAVVWQIVYMYQYRGDGAAYYAIGPLAACCVMILFLYPERVFNADIHHGLQTVFWLALGLVVYPVIAGLDWMEFL